MTKRLLFIILYFLASAKINAQELQQIIDKTGFDLISKNYELVIATGDSVLSSLPKNKRSQQDTYALFAYFTGTAYMQTG